MGKWYSLILAMLFVVSILAVTTISTPVEAQVTYKGPWVGSVIFYEEPSLPILVEKLIAGEYDITFNTIDTGTLFERIKAAGLPYTVSYGLYYEITLNYACKMNETTGEIIEPVFPNPSKLPRPEVEGKILFNPFCNPRIRYAFHFLTNREFIADRIAEGLAVPRYTALTPNFPDYARLYDEILKIERELAYNFAKAREIIFEEMVKMGAEYRDGKWYYKGEPVILIFLIRTEDVRKDIGDYLSSQLERLGFTVLRYYGAAGALAPYWIRADPYDGTMHLYTGGWITTVVARDQSGNFGYFYTKLGRPELLWQRIVNTPEFFEVARKLYYNEFRSMEERDQLMRRALWLSVTVENQRIFIINRVGIWARRPNVAIASDLAGGYSGAWLWPWTIRFTDRAPAANVNATVRIGYTQLLVEPWNPIGGSNWIFDQTVIRATGELPYYPDPYSGLYWPHRIKKAEVYVLDYIPMDKTMGWVELYKVPEVEVPDDAWLYYNCRTGTIVTRANATADEIRELFGVTYNLTAKPVVKTVVYYDDQLFTGAYRWHDNSTFHIADFIYTFIITFDRACNGSALYDSAYLPSFRAWLPNYRGFRIVQTNPLVIEYYTDIWYLDAEIQAGAAAAAFWPYYSQGPGPWHTVELFAQGERAGIVAFTSAKATALKVSQADLLRPPTALVETLLRNINDSYVPYPTVLSAYITPAEARTRWENLKRWYDTYGHMWVGNGPFYLHSFTTAPKRVEIRAYRAHIDSPEKYMIIGPEPYIPVIMAEIPTTINQGEPVTIMLELVDKAGMAYPEEYVDFVAYFIIHPRGIESGRATRVGGGLWRIDIPAEVTSNLPIGAAEFKIIAVSKIAGVPSTLSKVITVVIPPERIFQELERLRGEMGERIDEVARRLGGEISEVSARLGQLSSELANAIQVLGDSLARAIGDLKTSIDFMTGTINATMGVVQTQVGEVRTEIREAISGVRTDVGRAVEPVQREVETTRSQVETLTTVVYAVLGVSVIGLVMSIIGVVRKR